MSEADEERFSTLYCAPSHRRLRPPSGDFAGGCRRRSLRDIRDCLAKAGRRPRQSRRPPDWICRLIEGPGGQIDKRPISARIGSARSIAEGATDLEGREAIREWLLRADAAMERRNSIFHGEPVVEWNVFNENAMASGAGTLLHGSRRQGEQVTKTPLTVPGLQGALDELVAAYSEWQDIFRLIASWRLEMNSEASQDRAR